MPRMGKRLVAAGVREIMKEIEEEEEEENKKREASAMTNTASSSVPEQATPAAKKAKVVSPTASEKKARQLTRNLQSLISARLVWKASFKQMMRNGAVKGGRVEVP